MPTAPFSYPSHLRIINPSDALGTLPLFEITRSDSTFTETRQVDILHSAGGWKDGYPQGIEKISGRFLLDLKGYIIFKLDNNGKNGEGYELTNCIGWFDDTWELFTNDIIEEVLKDRKGNIDEI